MRSILSTPDYDETAADHETDHETPVDVLEPMDAESYKQAARHFLRLIEPVMGMFRDDKSSQWWHLQFALGTSFCMGKSMTYVGTLCGTDRAAISKGAVAMCHRLGLPPSPYMKDEEARETYSRVRKSQLS